VCTTNFEICEKRLKTLNEFYSIILEIEEKLQKDTIDVFLKFEPKFLNYNPDCILKFKRKSNRSYYLFCFEYKDCGYIDSLIKDEQLLKYDTISSADLKAYGLQILKNANFKEVILIFRNIKGKLFADEVVEKYSECKNKFKNKEHLRLYHYSYHDETQFKLSINPIDKSSYLNNYIPKQLIFKNWCQFILDYNPSFDKLKATQNDKTGTLDYSKFNLSILFTIALGHIFRNIWNNEPFTVKDLFAFWHKGTLKILNNSHNKDRILRFFNEAIKATFVKKGFLIANISEDGTISYVVNKEKKLNNRRTINSLRKMLSEYIEEEKLSKEFWKSLPLFSEGI